MLEAHHLTCVREDRTLFESLSFRVASGDLLQVEGPNGAGKTSLLRLLTGLSQPFEGKVTWQGEAIRHCRDRFHANLLYLGHQAGIKAGLSAYENLRFFQHLQPGDEPLDLWEILARVGLAGLEEQPCGQLSAGQQRRVALARLWLGRRTPLWILDEPFTAIDRHGVAVLEQLFLAHAQQGGMVVLTTHQELRLCRDRLRTLSLGQALRGAA